MQRSHRFPLRKATTALLAIATLSACGHLPLGATSKTAAGIRVAEVRTSATLTPEEQALLSEGLLPPNYPELAAAWAAGGVEAAEALDRAGLKGPFAGDFGDPSAMRDAARFAHTHTEYAKFLHSLKKGDVVFISENTGTEFVSRLTGGPFNHVMLCTDATVPGRFIDAVGVTGGNDGLGDRVRRDMSAGYASEDVTLRDARPTSEARVQDGAIAFATAQLGKPYNYTFADSLGGNDAYYCSSLVARAMQAGGYDWHVTKDASRDRMVQAFMAPPMSLQPVDTMQLASTTMQLLHQSPAPTPEAFASYIVNQVLPACRKTANLAITDTQKQHLAAAIAQVLEGKAFPRFTASATDYRNDAASGQFDRPVTGPALKAALEARMAEDCARDGAQLVATADINTWPALQALNAVLGAALPYADDLSAYLTGPTSSQTLAVAHLLDLLDSVRKLAPHWDPSRFGPANLPGRAAWGVDNDFVSPTDLAWTDVPHVDYNVLGGHPVNPPWPDALVPENGVFGVSLN